MDPTLRNRLLGASVLIVAAAIILPILLSGDPPAQHASQTRPLDIPQAPDPDMRRTVLPLGAEIPEADRVAPVDMIGGEAAPAAGTGATTDDSLAALPAPPAASPAATPTPAAPDTTDTAPASAAAPQADQAAAATAPAAGNDEGRFWVSLGGYGQAANVERVVNAAQGRGFTVQRESAGNLTRLRTGPYATRARAEQARQQLIAAVPDARPEVIELERASTAPPQDATSSRSGAWAVQVGAFAEQANARQLSERLRSAGFPAFVEARGQSHVVRVGPYVRRTEAESQRQQLRSAQGLADALIVAHAD